MVQLCCTNALDAQKFTVLSRVVAGVEERERESSGLLVGSIRSAAVVDMVICDGRKWDLLASGEGGELDSRKLY